MIANIVLLVLLFGARKKKINLYSAAATLGAIKAAVYFVFTRNAGLAVFMGFIFAALASGFVFFLKRLDRRAPGEEERVSEYGTPGTEKATFRWEYFPLSVILILLIGGELLISA